MAFEPWSSFLIQETLSFLKMGLPDIYEMRNFISDVIFQWLVVSWCEASGVIIVTGRRLSGDSRRSAVWVELGRPSSNPQKLWVELFAKRSADGSHTA